MEESMSNYDYAAIGRELVSALERGQSVTVRVARQIAPGPLFSARIGKGSSHVDANMDPTIQGALRKATAKSVDDRNWEADFDVYSLDNRQLRIGPNPGVPDLDALILVAVFGSGPGLYGGAHELVLCLSEQRKIELANLLTIGRTQP